MTNTINLFYNNGEGLNMNRISENLEGDPVILILKTKGSSANRRAVKKSSYSRRHWKVEDDLLLSQLVNEHGLRKWKKVSCHFKGRTGKQCRERWLNHVNPKLNKCAWTKEENLMLIAAHRCFGNKWSKIAKLLSGRSENGIKNHWNSLLKKKQLVCSHKFNVIGALDSSVSEPTSSDRSGLSSDGSHLSVTMNPLLVGLDIPVRCRMPIGGSNGLDCHNDKSSYYISNIPVQPDISNSNFTSAGVNLVNCDFLIQNPSLISINESTHPKMIFSTPQRVIKKLPDDDTISNKSITPLSDQELFLNFTQSFGTPPTPTPVKKSLLECQCSDLNSPILKLKDNVSQNDCRSDEIDAFNSPLNLSFDQFMKYLESSSSSNLFFKTPESVPRTSFLLSSRSSSSSLDCLKSKRHPIKKNSKAKKKLFFPESTSKEVNLFSSSNGSWEVIALGQTEDQMYLTKMAHDYLDLLK